jgi:hypothetical protein
MRAKTGKIKQILKFYGQFLDAFKKDFRAFLKDLFTGMIRERDMDEADTLNSAVEKQYDF